MDAASGEMSSSAQGALQYSLRQDPPPNTQIDFGEVVRQRETSKQLRLAASWNKLAKDVAAQAQQLRTCLYANWNHLSAQRTVEDLNLIWNSFEAIHVQYLPGIHERKRLQDVKERFESLKETMIATIEECERQVQIDKEKHNNDEEVSVRSEKSNRSRSSTASGTSSSSRKGKLRAVLLARKKLELAKSRAQEEAQLARAVHEQSTRKELRRLEEETVLAELDWKIERDYDEETGQVDGIDDETRQNYEVGKAPIQHHPGPPLEESEPRKSEIPSPTLRKASDFMPADYSTPLDKMPVPSRSVPGAGRPPTDKCNKGAPPVTDNQRPSYQNPRARQHEPKSDPVLQGAGSYAS